MYSLDDTCDSSEVRGAVETGDGGRSRWIRERGRDGGRSRWVRERGRASCGGCWYERGGCVFVFSGRRLLSFRKKLDCLWGRADEEDDASSAVGVRTGGLTGYDEMPRHIGFRGCFGGWGLGRCAMELLAREGMSRRVREVGVAIALGDVGLGVGVGRGVGALVVVAAARVVVVALVVVVFILLMLL